MKRSKATLHSIKKVGLMSGLDKALESFKVAALTKQADKVLFDYISRASDIVNDYSTTVLPPKKFFFPAEEVILEYTDTGKISAKIDAEPTVLFGIRPCDLNGLLLLDQAFSESNGDPNYMSKRENTVIIGIDCKKVCNEDAFCFRVNAHNAYGISDILLHEMGEEYGMSIYTQKGEDFAKKYFSTDKLDQDRLDIYKKEKESAFSSKGGAFQNLDKMPEIFEKSAKHPIWEEEGKKCLSCGSCVMVCPTCYCFDVQDEMALNLKSGQRLRRWDACMLREFAVVAGGENFRKSAVNRLKHRINRKFNFLMKKHGQSVCVGCGRCVQACLADISPNKIAQTIVTGDSK